MSEHRRWTPSTGRQCAGWLMLSAVLLTQGCATTTGQAQVVPSVLKEEVPAGDFQMRLLNFFGEKPEGQTN